MNQELLDRIEQFCKKKGIKESTFGLHAAGSGKFVDRIRNGGRIYKETEQKILDYIDNNIDKKYRIFNK